MAVTLSTAKSMLQKYIDAETAVLRGQETAFNGRRWRLADLATIRAGRKEWAARVAALEADQAPTSGVRRPRGAALASWSNE